MNLVSIIMPTYKRNPDLVGRAIKSLINQTYSNIEILVVDDNAKVGLELYRENINKLINDLSDPRIKYIKNENNLGGALSRNEGIFACSGNYVTFLDDDDEYENNKVEEQLEFIVKNDLDMCFSDLSIYNENGELIDYRKHDDIKNFNNEYLFKYHLTKQITGTPTFMIKKDFLIEIGGFDNAIMGQEFYLMSKIILANKKIGYFPKSNIKAYRYDIEAISTGPNKIKGQKILYEYKKSYFKMLTFKEKNYIKCRHYAVMAVAFKRNKKFIKCLLNLFLAVITNPFLSLKEAIGLNKRKKENKQ